ncbi:hypothetical protein BSNK01_04020 [Bacillaceae bacterium]
MQQQGGQRQGQQQTGRPQGKQQQKLPVFKPLEAERAKATALTVQGVDDAKAVVMDQQVSLAVKVTNFQRLRLKQIRREVHGKLSKQFPDYELHVTSDNKLFQELEKIEKKIASRHKDPAALQKLKKKLEKVNKDMKG